MKENIKNAVIDEIQPLAPRLNVPEALDLTEFVLSCDAPRDLHAIRTQFIPALEQMFDEEASFGEAKTAALNVFKVEQLMKIFLYHVNPVAYQDIDASKKGFYHALAHLGLNPGNVNLDSNPSSYAGHPNYLEHVCKVYHLRNDESHKAKLRTRRELFDQVDSILVTVFYCVLKNRRPLKQLTPLIQNYDVSSYMQELIDNFKDKMSKFIMLNGEENLQIADRFIFENRDHLESFKNVDATDKKKVDYRYGTINHIRKNAVPEQRMIIWGSAGTGKSTTLEYLAYLDAREYMQNNDNKIPVFVPLGLLTDVNETVFSYVSRKTRIRNTELELLLKQGKLNLFFDGINEIPENANGTLRRMRLTEIQNMINTYTNTFMILTNRPEEISVFQKIPVFNLQKLDDEQMQSFLEKNTSNSETIAIINNAIREKPKLKSVIRTPLMMSRLIEIVDATSMIPDSEGKIIGEFLSNLLKRERAEKKEMFDIKKADHLLRRIAFQGLEDSATNAGMSEETVLEYMNKCCIDYHFQVDTIYMLNIFLQLGILTRGDNQYRFSHQAYQDYYYSQEEAAILGI